MPGGGRGLRNHDGRQRMKKYSPILTRRFLCKNISWTKKGRLTELGRLLHEKHGKRTWGCASKRDQIAELKKDELLEGKDKAISICLVI